MKKSVNRIPKRSDTIWKKYQKLVFTQIDKTTLCNFDIKTRLFCFKTHCDVGYGDTYSRKIMSSYIFKNYCDNIKKPELCKMYQIDCSKEINIRNVDGKVIHVSFVRKI